MNNHVQFKVLSESSILTLEEFIQLAESVSASVFGAAQVKLFINTRISDSEINVKFHGDAGELYVSLITGFLIERYGSDGFEIEWKQLDPIFGGYHAQKLSQLHQRGKKSESDNGCDHGAYFHQRFRHGEMPFSR